MSEVVEQLNIKAEGQVGILILIASTERGSGVGQESDPNTSIE